MLPLRRGVHLPAWPRVLVRRGRGREARLRAGRGRGEGLRLSGVSRRAKDAAREKWDRQDAKESLERLKGWLIQPAISRLESKTLTGVAVTLAALLVISATAGFYYYTQVSQSDQSKSSYVSELSTANNQYQSLASEYNASLSSYNQTLALLATTIAALNTSLPAYQTASTELANLWDEYLALKPAASSLYTADILLDFGNGTMKWFNGTSVQPGWNLYTETVVLTAGNMQATWYPEYQEHLVSGIDGVSSTATHAWFLWTYNGTASWQTAQVGADELTVYNGSIFAWTYCAESASYAPECTP